ncbi:caspase family protein [Verrucomicrobiaceae bacterium 227]
MASRALIIAVQEYPKTTLGMMEKTLPGVIDSAVAFKQWLEQKWLEENVAEHHIIFCSEPPQPGGLGASWDEIVSSLEQLQKDSVIASTDELFFYFSGHGFRFERSFGTQSDVLVASDFESRGNLCLKLDEIVNWLRSHLGRGKQYFFIDACRNVLDSSQIRVNDTLPWNPTINGEASSYVLQSTVSGAPALVASAFASTLLGGLRGESRAKIWSENPANGMLVRYDSLRTYLKKKLSNEQPITSRVDGEDGETDAIFRRLSPPPESTLKVDLKNMVAGQKATLIITRLRDRSTRSLEITSSLELQVEPDNYLIEITSPDLAFQPAGEQEIDLYEAKQELVFEVDPLGLEMSFSPPPTEIEADVELQLPDTSHLEIRGIDQEINRTIRNSGTETLPHGRYETTLRANSGTILRKMTLDLGKGTAKAFDPVGIRTSTPHGNILRELNQPGVSPWFSESLGGGMDDPDLSLWLTILAGGKIIGSNARFSKLSHFKLHDFSALSPGSSAIYVIAGFESSQRTLKIATGMGPEVEWTKTTTPNGLDGIKEGVLTPPQGPAFISLQIDDLESITIASCQLPNRVTLLVLTEEEDIPVLTQFILPLGHLADELEPRFKNQLTQRNPLADLKFLAQATRAFRHRRKLAGEFSGSELTELLDGHWLDPVGAALAAYELARRGDHHLLHQIAGHLMRHFPDFPDGPAIARLAGQEIPPVGVPLFLEGWLPLSRSPEAPPAPNGNLNYRSPITSWLGAIR